MRLYRYSVTATSTLFSTIPLLPAHQVDSNLAKQPATDIEDFEVCPWRSEERLEAESYLIIACLVVFLLKSRSSRRGHYARANKLAP
jgi:hypothetical protein